MRLIHFLESLTESTAEQAYQKYNQVKNSIRDRNFIEDIDNFLNLNIIWHVASSSKNTFSFKFNNNDIDIIKEFVKEDSSNVTVKERSGKSSNGREKYSISIEIDGYTFQFIASNGKSKGADVVGMHRSLGGKFEQELFDDIINFINGNTDKIKYKNIVNKLNEIVTSKKLEITNIRSDAANNTRRSLQISSNSVIAQSLSGSNDIGSTVSDLTLICSNASGQTKEIYLSLKKGSSVTFCNLGISKILPQSEIKSGTITNAQGLTLLKMFGLDPEKFCSVFNNYVKTNTRPRKISSGQNDKDKINKSMFKTFVQSVIGYGYILVHENGSKTHVEEITESWLNSLSLHSAEIVYPQNKKSVDIYTEWNNGLHILFNFRDKQGGLYPTSLQADYKFK